MDRITQGYMENFAASQELQDTSNETRIFELFACYCVLSREYGESFDLSDIVTGGGNDGGIDGIAIIANNVLIHSSEEFDDLIESRKAISDLKFIFVQAKTSAEFKGSDIATFGFGVQDLFKENPELLQNDEVKDKASIISHILSKMIHVKEKPACLLYYVTLGRWTKDQNVQARIDGVRNDLLGENLFSKVEFNPIDANSIQKLYKSTVDKIEREIDFPDRITLPEMDKIHEAYLGILSAKQFLSLVSDEEGIIKSVLSDNIRDYQGDNDVNGEIAATLNSPDSDKFVIFNNGITIICKDLRNIVRNRFLLSDYQIVNGCQTTHVLFYNRAQLSDNVFVSVKIISTSDEETVNHIIKATNRQTGVTDEQLMSLTDFHKRLEAYYKTFTGQQKLYYERRSKQYAGNPDIEKVRIVSIPTQIKAFASMFMDKPHLASRYYGRLLKDSGDIFSTNHSLAPYYTSAFALYRLDFLIRNKQIDQACNRYRFHILMIIKYLVLDNNRQPPMNSREMERLCGRIQNVLNNSEKLINSVKKAMKIISKQVPNLADSENTKTLAVVDKIKVSCGQPKHAVD